MARKITRLTLDELRKEILALPEEEQRLYFGGAKGDDGDPYTEEEYLRFVLSGSWLGGYVLLSEAQISSYRQSNGGLPGAMSHSHPNAMYIEPHIVLDEVEVVAQRPHITGSFADEFFRREREMYGHGGSGMFGIGAPIILPSGDGHSSPGGGGGSASQGQGTVQSWLNLSEEFKKYNISLSVDKSLKASLSLQKVLSSLLSSKSFSLLLNRLETHGIPTSIGIETLGSEQAGYIRSGLTILKGSEVKVLINQSFLNVSDSIGAAGTVIHEMIHARLQGVFGSYGIDPDSIYGSSLDTPTRQRFESDAFKKNYPGLYDYYSRYPFRDAEHELMSVHYRPLIKEALKEAFPGYADDVYEALSWSGLDQTQAWNGLKGDVRDRYEKEIRKYKI